MRHLILPILGVMLILTGCQGGDSPTDPAGTAPADNTPLTAEQLQFAPLVFSAGYLVSEATQSALYTVTEALFIAGDQAGGSVTTGTLTVLGGNSYQYSPIPADRLVIQSGGQTVEIFIQELTLSAQADPTAYGTAGHFYLADVHQALNFRIVGTGVDLTVLSSSEPRPGGVASAYTRQVQRNRTITGSLTTVDGDQLTVDITDNGPRDFTFDPGVSDATDESSTLTGTVLWNNHPITVNETAHFIQERDVTSLDGTPQYTVQNLFRTCGGSGQIDGEVFGFQNASVQSESRNGAVNQPSFWTVTGILTRDGGRLGGLRFDQTPQQGGGLPRLEADLSITGQADLLIQGATLGG